MIRAYSHSPLADQGEVNVLDFGAVGDDSTDSAPGIMAAIAYVKATWPTGGKIVVPPGTFQLTTEVVLDSDALTLEIQPGAILKQMTFGFSCVQIRSASRCTVNGGGKLLNPVVKYEIVGSGNYNGNPARSRAAGVYQAATNYCTVENLTIENFITGCGYYQLEANNLTTWCVGNRLLNLNLVHFDFGMAGSNQRDMTIDGCKGTYTDRSQGTVPDDDNGPAPHMIYMSGKINNNLKNQNITITNCHDFYNPFSSSFKAKYTDGIVFNGMQSQLAVRGFDLDIQNGRIVSPIVRDLLGQTGLSFGATCSDVEIIAPLVYIRTEAEMPEYAALIDAVEGTINFDTIKAFTADEETSNITVRGGRFSHRHTINESMVQLSGTNLQIIDTVLEERGFDAYPVNVKATAVNCKIIRPAVWHGQRLVATSGTYEPANGKVTLNVNSNVAFPIGSTVVVSGATGTGAFASINGTQTTIAGTVGDSVKFTIAAALTMTITGAAVLSGSAGTRVAAIVAGATNTAILVDPLMLNFTYAASSVSDAGTGTSVRMADGNLAGTWTPVPTFTTPGTFAPTVGTAQGWYRREGDWAWVGATLIITNTNAYSGAGGDFRLTGLPFTVVTPAVGGFTFTTALGQYRSITGTFNDLGVQIGSGDNFFTFRYSVAAGAGNFLGPANIPASTADVRLMFQMLVRIA